MNDPEGHEMFGIGMPAHAGASMHFKDAAGNVIAGLPGPPVARLRMWGSRRRSKRGDGQGILRRAA